MQHVDVAMVVVVLRWNPMRFTVTKMVDNKYFSTTRTFGPRELSGSGSHDCTKTPPCVIEFAVKCHLVLFYTAFHLNTLH